MTRAPKPQLIASASALPGMFRLNLYGAGQLVQMGMTKTVDGVLLPCRFATPANYLSGVRFCYRIAPLPYSGT